MAIWKKGQSGNPRGRPRKGKTLTDILEKYSSICVETVDGKKISQKELLAEKVWGLTLSGYLPAIKYIYDRIDGKPTETVRQVNRESGPLRVEYVLVRPDERDKTDEKEVVK